MVEPSQKTHTLLLLGEGNFSYALARAKLHQTQDNVKLNMVATSFDSYEDVILKYPESHGILASLQKMPDMNISVKHDVDATNIPAAIGELLTGESVEITFCHPHIGSEDLKRNSALVAHFFNSAMQIIKAHQGGQVI